jgi:hypothetical protein
MDLSGVKRKADRALLEQLERQGDDMSAARHTLVFFYRRKDERRDSELVLNPVAQRLQTAGWAICGLDADGVIAEAQRFVDPDTVNRLSEEMEAIAAEFGVDFDGWECAVITGDASE